MSTSPDDAKRRPSLRSAPDKVHSDDGDLITRKILEAALESFGRVGFKKTTIRGIAASAGVSRPTLYARYEDKVALIRGVAAMVNRDALDAVARIIDEGGPFKRVLTKVLIAYFGDSHQMLSELPHLEELVDRQGEHVRAAIEDGQREFRSRLAKLLRKSVQEGTIEIRPTGVGVDQIVEILALSPMAFKSESASVDQLHRRLESLARVVAYALLA